MLQWIPAIIGVKGNEGSFVPDGEKSREGNGKSVEIKTNHTSPSPNLGRRLKPHLQKNCMLNGKMTSTGNLEDVPSTK